MAQAKRTTAKRTTTKTSRTKPTTKAKKQAAPTAASRSKVKTVVAAKTSRPSLRQRFSIAGRRGNSVRSQNSGEFAGIRRLNVVAGILLLGQAVAIFLLSSATRGVKPLTVSFLTKDELQSRAAGYDVFTQGTHRVVDLNVAYMVAAFLVLAGLTHLLASTLLRRRYETEHALGFNRLRWFGGALSIGTLLVTVGMLSGIFDIATLKSLFVLTALMCVFGLIFETVSQRRERPYWLAYWAGALTGAAVWLILVMYAWSSFEYGVDLPSYVLWVYAITFLGFAAFAVNLYLQYKRVGIWKDYSYGERLHIILSLVAISVVAWQVYAGTLRS